MTNLLADDLGREVLIPEQPQRIISLCPSVTYSLIKLGCRNQLAGRTRYCIHPREEVAGIPVVGPVQGFSMDAVHALNPDLILAVKEENAKDEVLKLSELYPVFVFDVDDVEKNAAHLLKLGVLCGKEKEAEEIVGSFPKFALPQKALQSLYLIWKNPWMGVGANTYTGSVLSFFGLPQKAHFTEAYPKLSGQDFRDADLIMLSSEPFPFQEHHRKELQALYPDKKIILVEGEMFCWFGAWFANTEAYLESALRDI